MDPKNVLREDDFVYHIVKDPEHPPETLMITVFIGKSPEEGHTRIYLDPLLSAHLDVANDLILYSEPIPKTQSPIGGYFLWVRRDLPLLTRLQEGYQRAAQMVQELSATNQQTSGVAPTFNSMPMGWPGMVTQG
jgi:hypothetical protein